MDRGRILSTRVNKESDLYLDVRDYGAIGDGSTDDTAALQSAMDSSSALRACVLIPAKIFIISDALVVKTHTCIFGTGPSFDNRPGGSVIKAKTGYNGVLLREDNNTFQYSILIENITLDGNSKSATGGIRFGDPVMPSRGVFWTVLRNVTVSNIRGIGIYIAGGTTVTLDNVVTEFTTGHGFKFVGGYNYRLHNLTAEWVSAAGTAAFYVENAHNMDASSWYAEAVPVGFEITGTTENSTFNQLYSASITSDCSMKLTGKQFGNTYINATGFWNTKLLITSDVQYATIINSNFSGPLGGQDDGPASNPYIMNEAANVTWIDGRDMNSPFVQGDQIRIGRTSNNNYLDSDGTNVYVHSKGQVYWGDGTAGSIDTAAGKGTFPGGIQGPLDGVLGENAPAAAITTTLLASTSLTVGGGTPITAIRIYTPSLKPSEVTARSISEQTFTVAGLSVKDKIIVNPPALTNSTGIVGVRVRAPNTLEIRFINPTPEPKVPTAGVYSIIAIRD